MSDLSLAPDFVFTKDTKYSTIVSEFENGSEQRRARWGTKLREWTLQYRNRTAANVSTIQTLFDAQLGAYGSFTWTNPLDAVEYTVRFKEDSFKVLLTSPNSDGTGIFDFEFGLVEVR